MLCKNNKKLGLEMSTFLKDQIENLSMNDPENSWAGSFKLSCDIYEDMLK